VILVRSGRRSAISKPGEGCGALGLRLASASHHRLHAVRCARLPDCPTPPVSFQAADLSLQAPRLRTALAARLGRGALGVWYKLHERGSWIPAACWQPASWQPARREADSGHPPTLARTRAQARRGGRRGAGPAPDGRPDALHDRRQLLRPARGVRACRPLLPGCAPAPPRLHPGCTPAPPRVRYGFPRGALRLLPGRVPAREAQGRRACGARATAHRMPGFRPLRRMRMPRSTAHSHVSVRLGHVIAGAAGVHSVLGDGTGLQPWACMRSPVHYLLTHTRVLCADCRAACAGRAADRAAADGPGVGGGRPAGSRRSPGGGSARARAPAADLLRPAAVVAGWQMLCKTCETQSERCALGPWHAERERRVASSTLSFHTRQRSRKHRPPSSLSRGQLPHMTHSRPTQFIELPRVKPGTSHGASHS